MPAGSVPRAQSSQVKRPRRDHPCPPVIVEGCSVCKTRTSKSDQQKKSPQGAAVSQERGWATAVNSDNLCIRTLCAFSRSVMHRSHHELGLWNTPHKQSQQTEPLCDWILIQLHYYSGLPLAIHYSHMEPVWVVIAQSGARLYSGEHAFVCIL